MSCSLMSRAQPLLFDGQLNDSNQLPYTQDSNPAVTWFDYCLSYSVNNFLMPARLCVLILLLLMPCFLTYIIILWNFKATRSSNKEGRRAPLVPYSIPIVGHAMAFAFSVGHLIQGNLQLCDDYSPIRFKGMNVELSFISGPKNVFSLFRQSRKFSAKASVVIAIDRLFGTPKHLVPSFYDHDDTGYDAKPDFGARDVAPHLRIHHTVHVQVIKYLSGSGLKPMTNRLMENIAKTMLSSGIGGVWLEMDDLFDFCKMKLLHASINSMFGQYLTALHPDFVEDYWRFDSCTTTLVKGFPSFIVPRSWAARRKCLQSLKHWKLYVEKLVDADDRKAYVGLDPHFGSQFIRQRHEAFNNMEPMNADSIASEDLAIMWAANSNAIPAAYWFLYEIFRDPKLLQRVRSEVDGARIDTDDPNDPPRFDLGVLIKSPLLQSIYAETLRLQTAILIARMPAREDYKLGDYIFKKDKLLVAASYIAHHDIRVWNSGTEKDPHPLDKFWAERFLIKPGTEYSGPLSQSYRSERANTLAAVRPVPPSRVDSVMEDLTTKPGVKFSIDGLAGAWVPYGGGQSLCPGRHYAKQEMLMTFAIMSTCFDIEILQEPGEVTLPDLGYFGLGVLPPKNTTRCRIRRRKVRKDSVVE